MELLLGLRLLGSRVGSWYGRRLWYLPVRLGGLRLFMFVSGLRALDLIVRRVLLSVLNVRRLRRLWCLLMGLGRFTRL